MMMTSKSITELKPDYTRAMDIRGEPTSICICGSFVWNLKVSFAEDGTIGMYFRDMEEEYLQQMHADAELDTTGL